MNKLDFVCFSINNWEKRKARKQQFMLHLSLRDDVGKVIYIEPPLNIFRLILLPLAELKTPEDRKRWSRALSAKVECISDKLFLFTPVFFIPFARRAQMLYNINLFLSCRCIKNKLNSLYFKNTVLWIYNPLDHRLLDYFKDRRLACFDWAEDWAEYFTEYSKKKQDAVRSMEKKMAAGSDIVFTVSKKLLQRAREINADSYQLYDGTIPEIFLKPAGSAPADMKTIKHPIAGYAGTFFSRMDVALIRELSEKLPEFSFVFVGNVLSKPADIAVLKEKQNIFFLEGKEYGELPGYIANFDVCILPYILVPDTSPPTKIFDYLATGKPVVSVFLPELEIFKDLMNLAPTREEFITRVRESLGGEDPRAIQRRRDTAKNNSWAVRAGEIVKIVNKKLGRMT